LTEYFKQKTTLPKLYKREKEGLFFCAIKKITKAILPMPDTTMMSLSSTHLNVSGIPCVIASITDI